MTDEDVLAGLDFEVDEPDDVVDVSQLNLYALDVLMSDTRRKLPETQQMHLEPHQRSEQGKELHSIFLACQIERKRRIHN